ncbi:hypothetical protein [Kitasatospora terrestris]|uniref:DUF3040 domain-containing protein n=1 Tax=Kitasatospora terrestris TaxID=258051 RepID=A0ABP9DSH1_9ACTN
MDTRQDDLRRELDAALQTRKELGPEYEKEIIDSFVARLGGRLDGPVEHRPAPVPEKSRNRRFTIQILSLVMGVPLTAIAVEGAGVVGLLACWLGIVGVNVSSALGERIDRTRRSDWD